ncbi:MAG: hypothetical protein KDI65_03315 [Alphaproteobacteria bacterium]|nr:hypothetical protein [Alphaproteobacteria bacterium]
MSEPNKPKNSNDDTSRKAFSDKLNDFRNALSLVYIKKNISGRIKFMDKWGSAADYIFGPDLIQLDTYGASPEEFEYRNALEEEAEQRRVELKHTLADIEEKSVKSGSLIFEHVSHIIEKYGIEISRLVYADNIIERVRPGLLAQAEEARKKKEQEEAEAALKEEEAIRAKAQSLGAVPRSRPPRAPEVKPVSAVEIPDEVRPIDAGAALPAQGPEAPAQTELPSEPLQEQATDLSKPDSPQVAPPVSPPPVQTPEAAPIPEASQPESIPDAPPEAAPVSPPPAASPVVPPTFSKPEKGSCKSQFNRAVAQQAA